MRNRVFTITYVEERKVFWILISLALLLIGLYLYFVSVSVVNVLMREEAVLKTASLHSRISVLEAHYLREQDKITENLAEELGFVAVSKKHFVARAPVGRGLTLGE
jgi:hypothetical protein